MLFIVWRDRGKRETEDCLGLGVSTAKLPLTCMETPASSGLDAKFCSHHSHFSHVFGTRRKEWKQCTNEHLEVTCISDFLDCVVEGKFQLAVHAYYHQIIVVSLSHQGRPPPPTLHDSSSTQSKCEQPSPQKIFFSLMLI